MDAVITNVSFVTDFSVDPPAIFPSNPVETSVRTVPAVRRSVPYCREQRCAPQKPQCYSCLVALLVALLIC